MQLLYKNLLTEEFNVEISDHYSKNILYQHEYKSFVKGKTRFISISNPSCIDLFLENNALSFRSTKTVSSGLSVFFKLVLTVLQN